MTLSPRVVISLAVGSGEPLSSPKAILRMPCTVSFGSVSIMPKS